MSSERPPPVDQELLALCRGGAPTRSGAGFDLCLLGGAGAQSVHDPINAINTGLYNIGCVQDMLLGAVAYSMVQKGDLNPDEPMQDLLTASIGLRSPHHLQLQHLLTHSCGYLAPDAPVAGNKAALEFIGSQQPAFPPGEVVNYGGPEFFILMHLLETVAGESVQALIEREIFIPGGIWPYSFTREVAGPWVGLSSESLVRTIQFLRASGGPFGPSFMAALAQDRVATTKSEKAAWGRLPRGYSWGLAQFENDLWGQSGVTPSYAVGLRFHRAGDFAVGGAIEGNQVRRDAIIDRLCAAYGFPPGSAASSSVLGAVIGLEPVVAAGDYVGGQGRHALVMVENDQMHFLGFRRGQPETSFHATVDEQGILHGDARWPGARIEIFPHSQTGAPVLMLGLTAFVAQDSSVKWKN